MERVKDEQRIAPIGERPRKLAGQPESVVKLAQEEHARVVADVAFVEGDGHLLSAEKSEGGLGRSRDTVCHGGALSLSACWFSQTAS